MSDYWKQLLQRCFFLIHKCRGHASRFITLLPLRYNSEIIYICFSLARNSWFRHLSALIVIFRTLLHNKNVSALQLLTFLLYSHIIFNSALYCKLVAYVNWWIFFYILSTYPVTKKWLLKQQGSVMILNENKMRAWSWWKGIKGCSVFDWIVGQLVCCGGGVLERVQCLASSDINARLYLGAIPSARMPLPQLYKLFYFRGSCSFVWFICDSIFTKSTLKW